MEVKVTIGYVSSDESEGIGAEELNSCPKLVASTLVTATFEEE
jgi:hypothetical protein